MKYIRFFDFPFPLSSVLGIEFISFSSSDKPRLLSLYFSISLLNNRVPGWGVVAPSTMVEFLLWDLSVLSLICIVPED